jgi:hypothetical protein
MLRIISKLTLDINEELCACSIDWQKVSDREKSTKLMQILKETGIHWRERRYIANCICIRVLNFDWSRGRQEVPRLEEELERAHLVADSIQLVRRIPYQGRS